MKYPEQARRLKEAMNDNEIKAVELSEKTGVLKSSISQYVNGTIALTNIKAKILGDALNVNPLWLMGFDVPKYNDVEEEHYTDPKVKEIAEIVFQDKALQSLLDAAWKSRPEDISMAESLLRRLKETNYEEPQ